MGIQLNTQGLANMLKYTSKQFLAGPTPVASPSVAQGRDMSAVLYEQTVRGRVQGGGGGGVPVHYEQTVRGRVAKPGSRCGKCVPVHYEQTVRPCHDVGLRLHPVRRLLLVVVPQI